MAKSNARDSIKLTSVDDLFSTEESRVDSQREKVLEIPICCKIKIPNVANAKSRKLQVEIP